MINRAIEANINRGQFLSPDGVGGGVGSPEPRELQPLKGQLAVITGTSRGIGAGIARSLAEAGMDIIGNHVDPNPRKIQRQEEVGEYVMAQGSSFTDVLGDITDPSAREAILLAAIGSRENPRKVNALILNAAGGLESDKPEDWAEQINIHAQDALMNEFLPYMSEGGKIVYVTSWWAHGYRQVPQLAGYGAVARSKGDSERKMRYRIPEMQEKKVQFGVVVGNVVKDTGAYTIFSRLAPEELARLEPGAEGGKFPYPADMGRAVRGMLEHDIEPGHTVYVGGTYPERLHVPDRPLTRSEVNAVLHMYDDNKLLVDTFEMTGEDEGKGTYTVRPQDTQGHFAGKFKDIDIFRGVDQEEALAQILGLTYYFTEGDSGGVAVFRGANIRWNGMIFTGNTAELTSRIVLRTKDGLIGKGEIKVGNEVVAEAERLDLGIIPNEKLARRMVEMQRAKRSKPIEIPQE